MASGGFPRSVQTSDLHPVAGGFPEAGSNGRCCVFLFVVPELCSNSFAITEASQRSSVALRTKQRKNMDTCACHGACHGDLCKCSHGQPVQASFGWQVQPWAACVASVASLSCLSLLPVTRERSWSGPYPGLHSTTTKASVSRQQVATGGQ